jgi:hypothetical protein
MGNGSGRVHFRAAGRLTGRNPAHQLAGCTLETEPMRHFSKNLADIALA